MTRTISCILVPTDFSEASEAALDYATTLAARFGASLYLLHVVDEWFVTGAWGPEIYVSSSPAIRAEVIDEAARKLEGLLTRAERERLGATSEVRLGHAADAIRDVAAEQRCDLIVMGTHGHSGISHLLLGSVAETIVRSAPCPVLTVRGDAADAIATERACVADQFVAAEQEAGRIS